MDLWEGPTRPLSPLEQAHRLGDQAMRMLDHCIPVVEAAARFLDAYDGLGGDVQECYEELVTALKGVHKR